MRPRKQRKHIFGILLVCLSFGSMFSVCRSTSLAAKPSPSPVMLNDPIEITDQAGNPIDSLTLSVGPAVTIKLRSTTGNNIRITAVHFLDRFGDELFDSDPDPTRRPGITLNPDPVDLTLVRNSRPEEIKVTLTGVDIGHGIIIFPINNGTIEFDALEIFEDRSIVRVRTLDIHVISLPVPTLSEWGAIIMSFLLLTVGMMFIVRSRPMIAEANMTSDYAGFIKWTTRSLFVPAIFSKVLALTLGAVLAGFAVITWLSGRISALDIGGTMLCALIFAYVVHLLIVAAKDYQRHNQ